MVRIWANRAKKGAGARSMGAALAVRYRPVRSVIALDTPEE